MTPTGQYVELFLKKTFERFRDNLTLNYVSLFSQ